VEGYERDGRFEEASCECQAVSLDHTVAKKENGPVNSGGRSVSGGSITKRRRGSSGRGQREKDSQ